MSDDDYGYFGSGLEGYIHYTQAFNESFGSGDDAGGWDDTDISPKSSGSYIRYKTSPSQSSSTKSSTSQPRTYTGTPGKGAGSGKKTAPIGIYVFLGIMAAIIVILEILVS